MERLVRQCGSNNVPLLLCGRSPALLGKCAGKPTIVQPPPSQKNLVLVVFFQEKGKRASPPGCDLSDIRQHSRPVPSRAEDQKSPCLAWAQRNSQSSKSMSWTEDASRSGGGPGERSRRSQGRCFWLYLHISCHVEWWSNMQLSGALAGRQKCGSWLVLGTPVEMKCKIGIFFQVGL